MSTRWFFLPLSAAVATSCGWESEPSEQTASAGSAGEAGTVASEAGDGGSGGFSGETSAGESATSDAGAPSELGPCEPSPDALGQIEIPSPLVSLDLPVAASQSVTTPEKLVDGLYHSGSGSNFGLPTEDEPAWAAIEVGEGPSRLLLLWADVGYTAYNEVTGGAPLSYRIETSGDSTDGDDGSWETAVSVEENPVRSRGHSFEFSGKSWVRFVVTAAQPDATRVELDEIALFDISAAEGERPQDTWFFMGDSITEGAFHRSLGQENTFEARVHAAHEDYYPAVINGGIGGDRSAHGKSYIEEWLELNPDFQHFAIAYGTNDAWGNKSVESAGFEYNLRAIIEAILDAGRTPHLARIPFASLASHSTLPEFNAVIEQLTQEYELVCGPDLYTWFSEHQDQFNPDGVHPSSEGNVELIRLWADSADVSYPE